MISNPDYRVKGFDIIYFLTFGNFCDFGASNQVTEPELCIWRGVILLKKLRMIVLAGVVLAACTGFSIHFLGMEKLNLPFTEADIKTVTMYHCIVPAKAEQKVVKDPETIGRIYKTITELPIRNEAGTLIAGGETLEFEFLCADGTRFVLHTTQVQGGTQLTFPDGAVYTTHQAVLPLWYENRITAVQAE